MESASRNNVVDSSSRQQTMLRVTLRYVTLLIIVPHGGTHKLTPLYAEATLSCVAGVNNVRIDCVRTYTILRVGILLRIHVITRVLGLNLSWAWPTI